MVHMLGAEGTDEVSTATVKVHDGVATVLCAAVETGQGFTTLARQIVQETLGIDEVHVAPVDTDQPPAGPSCRGRHTWVSGGAVERAAKMVRTQLLQPLAHKFGMSTELLQITDGKITSYDGVLSTTVTEAMDGKELWATAQCRPHPTEPLDAAGQGDAFVASPSARSARWSTSTSSWARSASWNWPSPRTWAGSSTPPSSPPVSRRVSHRASAQR
jgi:CO/xanthine dehydrogenase Mo-binding subunit